MGETGLKNEIRLAWFIKKVNELGQHVMVTGRYLIEMPEMPGGITEFHPVYGIKILS